MLIALYVEEAWMNLRAKDGRKGVEKTRYKANCFT